MNLLIKRLLQFLTLLEFAIMLVNCGPSDVLVPLNKIEIPEYEDQDYLKLMDDKNPEVVYNAICNFISTASGYAQTLSSDTITDTVQINRAKLVYAKITEHLSSNNEWVLCSSLRFYANFGTAYRNNEELAKNLSKVKLTSKSVRIEFINAVKSLYGINDSLLNKFAKDYYTSNSWLVSRYSFSVLPYFNNNDFFDHFSSRFTASNEYDKLLFISGLYKNYDDKVLEFVLNSIESEKSEKVKLFLAKNLSKARNTKKVNGWLLVNYPILSSVKYPLAEFYLKSIEDTSSVKILKSLFELKMVPDSLIYGSNSVLFETASNILNAPDSVSNNYVLFKELFDLILASPKNKENWLKYKSEHSKPTYNDEFVTKQNALVEEYKVRAAKLYDKYGVKPKHRDSYIDRINDLKKEFEKEKQ